MGEEERGELGQTDGMNHTHIQAREEQGEEVAHFLHNVQAVSGRPAKFDAAG